VNTTLELQNDTKERLELLRALSDKAEAGDRETRQELRKAVRESSPEIVAHASDLAQKGQRTLIETAASGKPLMEEALSARLDLMRAEVSGENPTPLEVLLTERVVSSWLLVEVLEALMNAQLKRGKDAPRVSLSFLRFINGWLESAHHRHLSSIRELARIRKLQSNTPGVQYNTQINVSPSMGE
jgi:hypothetical protein